MRITRKAWPRGRRSPAPWGWPELMCLAAQVSLLGMAIAGAVNEASADYRWM